MQFVSPIDEDGLLAAETRLGRPLPASLRRVYELSDGLEAFGGTLSIEPALRASDLADDLRDSDWPIADELLIFGGDGSDEHWGLWYPSESPPDSPTPVIEVGAIFAPGSMAIVGTSLPAFLRTWTAMLLVAAGELVRQWTRSGYPTRFDACRETREQRRSFSGPTRRCRTLIRIHIVSDSIKPMSSGW